MHVVRLAGSLLWGLFVVLVVVALVALATAFWPVTIIVGPFAVAWLLHRGFKGLRAARRTP